jgi:hypothetical protein
VYSHLVRLIFYKGFVLSVLPMFGFPFGQIMTVLPNFIPKMVLLWLEQHLG